jgi:hypothetical protein
MPIANPTSTPTIDPTEEPTTMPTDAPTSTPTLSPTAEPTTTPTLVEGHRQSLNGSLSGASILNHIRTDGSCIGLACKAEELKQLEAEVEELERTLKVSPGNVCSGYVPNSGPWTSMGGSCQKWGSSSISWCYVNERAAGKGGHFVHASGTTPGKWFAPCENSADGFYDKLASEQRAKADALEARDLLTLQMTKALEAARREEADAKEAVYKAQSEADSAKQNADLESLKAMAASRACKAGTDESRADEETGHHLMQGNRAGIQGDVNNHTTIDMRLGGKDVKGILDGNQL